MSKRFAKAKKDYDFFQKNIGKIVSIEEIVNFTGRKESTVKINFSKKWYFFVSKKGNGYLINEKIKNYSFEKFRTLYEQKKKTRVDELENLNNRNKNFQPIEKINIKIFYSINNVILDNLSDKKEIYFLGENGVGKTILLQSILLAAIEEKEIPDYMYKFFKNNKIFDGVTIPNKRKIFGYGISRFKSSEYSPDNFGYSTLFDRDISLIHPVKWLERVQRLELKANNNNSNSKIIGLKKVIEFLEEIINIKKGDEFKINETETSFNFIERETILEFEQLADGFRSILIWLCDLLSRLVKSQPNVTELKNFEGIVLVDEIDMLLHPKWEYIIVKKIKDKLPNIQWFFSTHSPTLILGASKDAIIYKVYKNNEGETKISEPYKFEDYKHLTSNAFLTAPFMFDMPFSGTREMKDTDYYKNQLDTSGHFNIYKIYQAVEKRVKEIRKENNIVITEKDIENWISSAIAKQEEEK